MDSTLVWVTRTGDAPAPGEDDCSGCGRRFYSCFHAETDRRPSCEQARPASFAGPPAETRA